MLLAEVSDKIPSFPDFFLIAVVVALFCAFLAQVGRFMAVLSLLISAAPLLGIVQEVSNDVAMRTAVISEQGSWYYPLAILTLALPVCVTALSARRIFLRSPAPPGKRRCGRQQ